MDLEEKIGNAQKFREMDMRKLKRYNLEGTRGILIHREVLEKKEYKEELGKHKLQTLKLKYNNLIAQTMAIQMGLRHKGDYYRDSVSTLTIQISNAKEENEKLKKLQEILQKEVISFASKKSSVFNSTLKRPSA